MSENASSSNAVKKGNVWVKFSSEKKSSVFWSTGTDWKERFAILAEEAQKDSNAIPALVLYKIKKGVMTPFFSVPITKATVVQTSRKDDREQFCFNHRQDVSFSLANTKERCVMLSITLYYHFYNHCCNNVRRDSWVAAIEAWKDSTMINSVPNLKDIGNEMLSEYV